MILKAYKYRIYPKKQQAIFFAKHFGCVRFIYNWGLENKIKHYQKHKKSVSFYDVCTQMKDMKKKKETEWLRDVNSLFRWP